MTKNELIYIDRFSYIVFVLNAHYSFNKQRKNETLQKLRTVYPGDLKEDDVYRAGNFKKEKKELVLVNIKTKPLRGVCTTLLCCRMFSSYTGRILYATADYFEYIDLKNGLLLESNVYKRESNVPPDLKNVQVCAGLYKDLPSGCSNTYGFSSLKDIVKKYPDSIIGDSSFFNPVYFRRVFILTAALTLLCVGVHSVYVKNQNEKKTKQVAELQRIERETKEHERQVYLKSLHDRYTDIQKKSKMSIYKIITNIYTLTGNTISINSISVNGNVFQLEGESSDAVKTLQSFEKAEFVTEVEMRRIAVENAKEYFSIQGSMHNIMPQAPLFFDTEEEISFYENLIYKMEIPLLQNESTLSDISVALRRYLHKNNCRENLLQYIKTDTGVETECSLKCSAVDFFTFLQSVDTADVPFFLTLLRIKTTDTGIAVVFRIKPGNIYISPEDEIEAFSAQKLSGIFKRPKKSVRYAAQASAQSAPVQKDSPVRIMSAAHLVYVGSAEIEHVPYLFIKDTKANMLYRLPFNAPNGNTYRMLSENLLEVCIDGIYYEVKK